jgi:hypothetical protein
MTGVGDDGGGRVVRLPVGAGCLYGERRTEVKQQEGKATEDAMRES